RRRRRETAPAPARAFWRLARRGRGERRGPGERRGHFARARRADLPATALSLPAQWRAQAQRRTDAAAHAGRTLLACEPAARGPVAVRRTSPDVWWLVAVSLRRHNCNSIFQNPVAAHAF